jgi:hypothetical protein
MKRFIFVLLLTTSCICNASVKTIALRPTSETEIPSHVVARLCAQLGVNCKSDTTQTFVSKQKTLKVGALIDSLSPQIAIFRLNRNGDWVLNSIANFANFKHSFTKTLEIYHFPLTIYPALYPLGNDQWAVAVVGEIYIPFAGGSASIAVADFVEVPHSGTNMTEEGKTIYKNIPFSCSKMLRACFNESDSNSKHCHDESNGRLELSYSKGDKGAVVWHFRWREVTWPPHVPQSQTITTVKSLKIKPGNGEVDQQSLVNDICGSIPF